MWISHLTSLLVAYCSLTEGKLYNLPVSSCLTIIIVKSIVCAEMKEASDW